MQHLDTTSSVNFGLLVEHDELFIQLAAAVERAFSSDPNTSLIKLCQLREALAQHLAVLSGIKFDVQTTQADLFYKLGSKLKVKLLTRKLFHPLRIEGNKAVQHVQCMPCEQLYILPTT